MIDELSDHLLKRGGFLLFNFKEIQMSKIVKVEQKGSSVYAYSLGGSVLWVKNGKLLSFTGTTAVVENCGHIFVYDENGRDIG